MIEALRSDELMKKVGGKFKLTALIQRRWLQLLQGERPLVRDIEGLTEMEVVIREILEGKIEMELLQEGEEGESEEES
ncbi:MAG: DNA-directed RNA polymerase subunit omega [Phycisphaerales bacterium]|nr:MAG: DNA-directed RNA polymerase subunit omega [Phycisphaerales bacterium]